MKLLANENFPKASVMLLRQLGYDIAYIAETDQGVTDKAVMGIAATENRLILTFDRDYGELIYKHNYKPEQGVLYLRLNEYKPEEPAQIVHGLLSEFKIETTRSLIVYDGITIRQRKY
jgi:predicted nuclease of predicted toxin-antitoxin system